MREPVEIVPAPVASSLTDSVGNEMFRVMTTDHPEQKGLTLKHGPYATKDEAEQYAERLRLDGKWGTVTVDTGIIPIPYIISLTVED